MGTSFVPTDLIYNAFTVPGGAGTGSNRSAEQASRASFVLVVDAALRCPAFRIRRRVRASTAMLCCSGTGAYGFAWLAAWSAC